MLDFPIDKYFAIPVSFCECAFITIMQWNSIILIAFESHSFIATELDSKFLEKCICFYGFHSRPRWSRGTVLASKSKVRGFKSSWGRWIFSGSKNPEHKSSGRDFKMGVPSEISGSLKNLTPEKIGLWAKFNRHIHVLVIPKFGGAQ